MASLASLDVPALFQHQLYSPIESPDRLAGLRLMLQLPTRLHYCPFVGLSTAVSSYSSSYRNPYSRVFAMHVKAEGVEDAVESEVGLSYEKLKVLLAAGEWQLADEETRRLLIVLAGENAVKRKYVYFSEVQFIPESDLKAIDNLWRAFSGEKFGYSRQRRIWKSVDRDFTSFFKKVGWMKALESDPRQCTYRSFPSEFMWELGSSTPEGHLPLTNALRGTQLLNSILTHPAFDFADEDLSISAAFNFGDAQLLATGTPDLYAGKQSSNCKQQ
eukprot:c21687_g1_i1 orf=128-946(+)